MLRFTVRLASSVCVAVTTFDISWDIQLWSQEHRCRQLSRDPMRWWGQRPGLAQSMGYSYSKNWRRPHFYISTRTDMVHIKRVTALEGDIVKPKHRNELLLVPKGCCWMESDNPVNANDS
ncbi:hypothetical protein OSTOST_04948 [Ostertagia ostertagi]